MITNVLRIEMFLSLSRKFVRRSYVASLCKNLQSTPRAITHNSIKFASTEAGDEQVIVDVAKSKIDFKQYNFDEENEKLMAKYEQEVTIFSHISPSGTLNVIVDLFCRCSI